MGEVQCHAQIAALALTMHHSLRPSSQVTLDARSLSVLPYLYRILQCILKRKGLLLSVVQMSHDMSALPYPLPSFLQLPEGAGALGEGDELLLSVAHNTRTGARRATSASLVAKAANRRELGQVHICLC